MLSRGKGSVGRSLRSGRARTETQRRTRLRTRWALNPETSAGRSLYLTSRVAGSRLGAARGSSGGASIVSRNATWYWAIIPGAFSTSVLYRSRKRYFRFRSIAGGVVGDGAAS